MIQWQYHVVCLSECKQGWLKPLTNPNPNPNPCHLEMFVVALLHAPILTFLNKCLHLFWVTFFLYIYLSLWIVWKRFESDKLRNSRKTITDLLAFARTRAWNSSNNKFPLRTHWLLLMPRDPDYPAYTVFAKGLIPHIICPLSLNPTHSLFLSLPPFLSPSLPSPSPNHPDIKFYICTFNRLGWARDQSILVEFIATCRLNYSMEHTGKKT